MKELYKGKYRGMTLRAGWWDYRKSAGYFVTFNVSGRAWEFGRITDGKMNLSQSGKIVEDLWKEIPERFPYIELDAFVIMPDHVHAILILKDCGGSSCWINPATTATNPATTNPATTITTNPAKETSETPPDIFGDYNPMTHNTLSKVIRWFKGRATFEIRKTNRQFAWQSRYYDRIIRDGIELDRIRKYIRLNPEKWQK